MEPEPTDEPIAPWDSAYDHFARLLGGPRAEGCGPILLQPASARLRNGKDLPRNRRIVEDAIGKGELILAGEDGKPEPLPEDDSPFLVHWPATDPRAIEDRFGKALEVLQLGRPLCQPVRPRETRRTAQAAMMAAYPATPSPIVAVIDDGIGFLNRRFCKPGTPATTRFHAVWLQAFRTVHSSGGMPGFVQTGRTLSRAEIDAWLAQGERLDEAAVYREINRALLEPGAHRSTEMSFSHGTHVLDIAAGADPAAADPVSDWPLLAVQLPPEAVDNTAGTQLEPMLVQGVRWCLRQADAIGGAAPLVIVVAFATFAGPKDGTKAVEALIRLATEAWRSRTGREVRVVFSFGNSRLTRQAARLEVGTADAALDWRLLPEDFTASYLELRPDDAADMARLRVTLTPPGGVPQVLGPIAANTARPIRDRQGRVVGRYYHIGLRTTAPGVTSPAHGVLAMRPTTGTGSAPAAAHGAWQVALAATAGAPLTLRAEVQRDDTPGGYRQKGRQSYLDHPAAHVWEDETGGWTGLDPAGPITRSGAHSSFVTAPSAAMLCVGAGRAADAAPSRYSGEGAAWTRPEPTLAALADRGPATRGLIATGTLSGAARALDGTSVAAGRAARAIAALYDANGAGAPGPAEVADLLGAYGWPAPPLPARLGAGLLGGPPDAGPALVA